MACIKSSYCKNHVTLRNKLCGQNSGIFTFEVCGRQWLLNFMFFWPCIIVDTCFNNQINAQFLYSITICLLHYNPRHVSNINMLQRNSPQTGHTTLSSTPYRQLENQAPNTTGSNNLYNTLELLMMMGIMMPETCWASNKICNKNHLLHLVGILFPHINDDARSKPH